MRRVPVRWVGLEESPLIFSNSLLVQHTEHEFIISFGQLQPPIILGQEPDELAKVEYVQSRVAVRIALPPTRVQELLQVLNQNFQTYLRQIGAQNPEQGQGEGNASSRSQTE